MIIELKDYKHLFEGNDATLAVQEALLACKAHPGSTLKLGGGELHFYKKYAFEKEYYISNNDYSKKSIIFPLIGMKDLTIDGEGADLLFHGEVLPFVLDGSETITLKNFTVDYPQPFFFQADITAAGEDFLELQFDTREFNVRVEGRELVFFSPIDHWEKRSSKVLVTEFEQETKIPSAYQRPYIVYLPEEKEDSFLGGFFRYLTATQSAPNCLRFDGDLKQIHTVGNKWVCTFSMDRDYPGIFGNRTKDILIQDVTLYQTYSMGVICQLCENVTMEHLKTVPREGSGRFLSVAADATHFVNCSGFVRYEGCTFTNMLDDAGNVHGIYTRYARMINEHTILVTYGHYQQKGQNLYDPGDHVRIIDNRDMTTVADMTVKCSSLLSGDFLRLEFEELLPEMLDGFTVENYTRMPELYINNCFSGYNRPRGFLPATWKRIEITNNVFSNMEPAIHMTADCVDWFEAGPANDVLIKGNHFKNAAFTGGPVLLIGPNTKSCKEPFSKNILIEDNLFEMNDERFLVVDHVENLVFRNNRFIQREDLPAHQKIGENGFAIGEHCKDVVIEEMK